MDRLGKYEIVGVIGEGGMGMVYHARDSVIGRDVAIKVIQERALNVPEVRDRFLREAQAAGRLAHENIMVIHDVGEQDDQPFIVMEFLGGTDLRKILDARRRLTLDEKLFIATQICEGLHYAHEQQVVHRDVKPDNIRVLRDNRVKIMDFGIARLNADVKTLTNTSIGTPRYMSPEQVKGTRVDQRSDIFSFGVLFYELLTGTNPFWGEHVTTVIYKILHEEPEPIHLDDTSLEHDLQAIVSRCLAKTPEERYQSMAQVVADLRTAMLKRGGTSALSPRMLHDETRVLEPDALVSKTPDGPRRQFQVPRPVLIIFAMVALVAVLLLIFLPDRTPDGAPAIEPREQMAAAGSAATGPSAEELTMLSEEARQLRQRMVDERERASAASAPTGAGTPFAEALALEQAGDDAMDRGDETGLREAHAAFERAAVLYGEASLAAAGSNQAALRAQAEEAQRAAQRAVSRLGDAAGQSAYAGAISAAGASRQAGEQALQAEDYAAAVRAFRDAESRYGEIRRQHERLMARRQEAEQARSDVAASASAVQGARSTETLASRFRDADAARSRGESQFANGDFDGAVQSFQSAQVAYESIEQAHAQAGQAALARRRGQAEQAREVMLAALGNVPDAQRSHDDFRRAEGARAAGTEAFASGAFDQAEARFQEAATLFEELSSRPSGPSREALADQAVSRLAQQVKNAFENEDIATLQAISSEFSSWRDFFAVASGIAATVNASGLQVAGDESRVTMQIQLNYLDNRNRRQSTPTLRQDWTLRYVGDDWRVAHVAPR